MRCSLLISLALAMVLPACGRESDGDDGSDGDADVDADADGDADGDADACAVPGDAGLVSLELLADSVPVSTCVEGRWRLNVRICGEASDAACGDATGGPCGEDNEGLLLGDACADDAFTMPTPGTYTLCVEAELVNGFLNYESCAEVVIGADGAPDPIELDLDTEGQFPCNRDWSYDPDENMCCDHNVGYCAPPDF